MRCGSIRPWKRYFFFPSANLSAQLELIKNPIDGTVYFNRETIFIGNKLESTRWTELAACLTTDSTVCPWSERHGQSGERNDKGSRLTYLKSSIQSVRIDMPQKERKKKKPERRISRTGWNARSLKRASRSRRNLEIALGSARPGRWKGKIIIIERRSRSGNFESNDLVIVSLGEPKDLR